MLGARPGMQGAQPRAATSVLLIAQGTSKPVRWGPVAAAATELGGGPRHLDPDHSFQSAARDAPGLPWGSGL